MENIDLTFEVFIISGNLIDFNKEQAKNVHFIEVTKDVSKLDISIESKFSQ